MDHQTQVDRALDFVNALTYGMPPELRELPAQVETTLTAQCLTNLCLQRQ